eukprot:2947498-Prymnesium_polylepis.1
MGSRAIAAKHGSRPREWRGCGRQRAAQPKCGSSMSPSKSSLLLRARSPKLPAAAPSPLTKPSAASAIATRSSSRLPQHAGGAVRQRGAARSDEGRVSGA